MYVITHLLASGVDFQQTQLFFHSFWQSQSQYFQHILALSQIFHYRQQPKKQERLNNKFLQWNLCKTESCS